MLRHFDAQSGRWIVSQALNSCHLRNIMMIIVSCYVASGIALKFPLSDSLTPPGQLLSIQAIINPHLGRPLT